MSKPYDSLFDPECQDASIWHGWPGGNQSFGLVDAKRPAALTKRDMTDTTGGESSTARNWPFLSHGTLQAVLPDALNVWVEAPGLDRRAFQRKAWKWQPTQLAGTWQAGDIQLDLKVALDGPDQALIVIAVRYAGGSPFRGRLIIQGDDNYITLLSSGSCEMEGSFRWQNGATVVVSKTPVWASEMDCFPYYRILREEKPFYYTPCHYAFALAFRGEGWRTGSSAGSSKFVTWQIAREVELAPGGSVEFVVGFAGKWFGRSLPAEAAVTKLADDAGNAAGQTSWVEVVHKSRVMWEAFLDRVPVLKQAWPREWMRLYYKAWVTVYYNLLPAGDMVWYQTKHPAVTTCKVANSAFTNVASWEGALGALLLALVEPRLACECLEAIYETTAEDGYLAEAIGPCRSTQLACVEPFVAWVCFKKSGDLAFLQRIYDPMRRNLFYKLHFPSFGHGGPFLCRNYAYGHIAALYALKIAERLGRPEDDLNRFRQAMKETDRIVNTVFWDSQGGYFRSVFLMMIYCTLKNRENMLPQVIPDETDGETLVALFRVARLEQRARLLETIRREFLAETGVLTKAPRTLAYASTIAPAAQRAFTVKESNHMFLYKGLKEADRKLFETVARGTIANIARDGDFWEGYTVSGQGRYNGPGTIFGAFGVIWALLMMEDQVDELYE